MNAKLGHRHGLARQWALSAKSDAEVIEEVYLNTLTRFPSPDELTLMQSALKATNTDRHQAIEDMLWAVMNTKEFLYNH